MAIDYTTPVGQVRLLLNDIDNPDETYPDESHLVFASEEINAFLAIEGGNVKRAAAQAIDAQATNEALAAKVLKGHQVSTDGAALANAMRKHADSLRKQADRDDDLTDDGFYFGTVDLGGNGPHGPEHTAGYL